jgi:hypothetical protein
MGTEVVECTFTEAYGRYRELLKSVGLSPDADALAEHLSGGKDGEIRTALSRAEDGAEWVEVPERAAELMDDLTLNLVRQLADGVEEITESRPRGEGGLLAVLEQLSNAQQDAVADRLRRSGHSRFLKRRYIDGAAFQRVLDSHPDPDSLALVKLVPYLRRQLGERGYALTNEEVRAFFEEQSSRVPYCVKSIMQQVNGQFSKGLIPMEDMIGDSDPDEWLEAARCKLLFRSHSSMHKAIAECTSLKYDCVHKALSGSKKAKRIQAEIKYCLERWLKAREEGRRIDVDDDYRGVPVEWTCELLPKLEQMFDSKEEIYREISSRTGIKSGSVRRYFQSNGQLKHAPLVVYRLAKELIKEQGTGPGDERSYLSKDATRRAAYKLAEEVNEAYRRYERSDGDPELLSEYRALRRALIVTMKEQHTAVPVAV